MRPRPRVIVCGTKFGRVYLSAFWLPDFPFELAGILAYGSERSQACARDYNVRLYRDPAELPPDIDIACVVVGAALNGGPGAQLAKALMARGIHILQEHPLHHDELVDCLRIARANKVVYRLNTHYIHLDPVRRFLQAASAVLRQHPCLFIEATAGFQTSYTLLDIIGRALGFLRPWGLADAYELPADLKTMTALERPYRVIDGVLGGVPFSIRIQNQMDPSSPDNHAHIFHRITLGYAAGTLTLVNTHGPVVWCPQPHMPSDSLQSSAIEHSVDPHLDLSSSTILGNAEAPSYREILGSIWPKGVARALTETWEAVEDGDESTSLGQYYLTLCRLWRDMTAKLGPIIMIKRQPPPIFPMETLLQDLESPPTAATYGRLKTGHSE